MRLNLSLLGKIKLGLHTVQALLIFVSICMWIAMATKEGHQEGRTIYFMILCFASIPALIYLVGVPMWTRTQRFANLFAFLGLDIGFSVFWLAAWAAILAWVRAGQAVGYEKLSKEDKEKESKSCKHFDPEKFGIEAKCRLGYNLVGLGVVIFLFFIATSVVSFLYFQKLRSDNISEPWLGNEKHAGAAYTAADEGEDGKGVWSSNVNDEDTSYNAQHNNFGQRPGSGGTEHGGDKYDDEYDLVHGGSDSLHMTSVVGSHAGAPSSVGAPTASTVSAAYTDNDPGRRHSRPYDEASYGRADDPFGDDSAYNGSTGYSGAQGGAGQHPYGPPPPPGPRRDEQRVSFPSAPYGYDRQT